MNTTIPLSKLTELLANRADIESLAAESFIRAFFDSIEQGLVADGRVSIKELGEFILTPDNSILFNPAEKFSVSVNAAFDAFPVIELGEGVKVEDILDLQPAAIVPPTATPVKEEKEESINTSPADETVETEEIQESFPEADITEVEVSMDKNLGDDISQPGQGENIVISQPESATATENYDEKDDEDEDEENEEYNITPQRRCCTALWIILAVFFGLIAGIVLGYLGRDRIEAFVEAKTTSTKDSVVIDNKQTPQTRIIEEQTDTAPLQISSEDIADINDPSTDPEKLNENTVRYDVVSGNRFLTTMARQYYGHQDYWSYIYKANESTLRHPDRIRPGTRVVIPDFEKYRTSDDPEQNRRDARRMGIEIYNRFQ